MPENLMSSDYSRFTVSTSRFEKGEADRIIEELEETGFKAVLNGGQPCGVLVSLETLKNYMLLLQAYQEKADGQNPSFKDTVQQFAEEVDSFKKVANLKFTFRRSETDKEIH